MKKINLVLVIIISSINFSAAQTELRYEHYTIANGMSSNFTKAITQDTYGFLWIGTIDGLNSFNGYDFTTYYHRDADSTTLSDNSINDVLIDKNGTLWVATNKGLNMFIRSSKTFKRFFSGTDNNSTETLFINDIESDSEGNLWLGTDEGIRILNTKNNAIYTPEIKNDSLRKFVSDGIDGIRFDSKGKVWLASSVKNGFRLADKKTLQPVAFNPDANSVSLVGHQVSGFFEDSKGLIWVLTDDGLLSYSYLSNTLKRYAREEAPNEIATYTATSVMENKQGEIWVCIAANPPYYNSIAKVNPNAGTFKVYPYVDNDERGLSWSWASFMFQDLSGIYWVGTSRGLDKMDPLCQQFKLRQQFTNLKYSQFNNIYSLARDGDNLWLATDGKGLIKYDLKTNKFEQVFNKGQFKDIGLYVILLLTDKNLLLGTEAGVYIYNPYAKSLKQLLSPPTPTGNTNSQVSCMINGPNDNVWIAFYGGGIMSYNLKTKSQKSYRHDENNSKSLCSDQSNVLFFDKKGTLWVGSADGVNALGGLPGKGLDRFNAADETFTHFTHSEIDSTSISSTNVICIAEDSNGMLWVGTRNGGLNMFNPKTEKFKHYTKTEGMPSNFITAIQIDDSNTIWVSTFTNGVASLNPATGAIRVFDVTYGLQNIRFNRQATYKAPDGEIYFGGVSGFNSFNPAQIKYNKTAPTVYISNIKVNNATYLGDTALYDIKEIELKYNQSELQFDFVAMNFSQSYKNQYAYQLVGYDKDWINAGTERTAKYTNLDPATYVFKVKACNNDGIWNEAGTSVVIIISPPWWKTWWAYMGYFFGFAGTMIGFAFWRAESLRQKNKLLEEKVTLRTKELETKSSDLESSLNDLKSTQSQLVQQEKLASLGALTAGIAHEIKNPLNFVNNFSELSTELVDEFIETKDETERQEIGADLKINLQKINEHGKRADSIVKNMLQHSRSGSGEKQFSDINQLCDEYFNLAFHGKRATDANFNCEMVKSLDKTLPQINCVVQDISRVILNLINNSFDAVRERELEGKTPNYKPSVTLTTKQINNTISISFSDNGKGIPQHIKEKIFEPFFTTKPAGQGTGLGLSLSYDIVKAHGGELIVETKSVSANSDLNGTVFKIVLPL